MLVSFLEMVKSPNRSKGIKSEISLNLAKSNIDQKPFFFKFKPKIKKTQKAQLELIPV